MIKNDKAKIWNQTNFTLAPKILLLFCEAAVKFVLNYLFYFFEYLLYFDTRMDDFDVGGVVWMEFFIMSWDQSKEEKEEGGCE